MPAIGYQTFNFYLFSFQIIPCIPLFADKGNLQCPRLPIKKFEKFIGSFGLIYKVFIARFNFLRCKVRTVSAYIGKLIHISECRSQCLSATTGKSCNSTILTVRNSSVILFNIWKNIFVLNHLQTVSTALLLLYSRPIGSPGLRPPFWAAICAATFPLGITTIMGAAFPWAIRLSRIKLTCPTLKMFLPYPSFR